MSLDAAAVCGRLISVRYSAPENAYVGETRYVSNGDVRTFLRSDTSRARFLPVYVYQQVTCYQLIGAVGQE